MKRIGNGLAAFVMMGLMWGSCGCTDKEAIIITPADTLSAGYEVEEDSKSKSKEELAEGTETAETARTAESAGTAEVAKTERMPAGQNPEGEENRLLVHICGAVVNPGVYELEEGKRIWHAVEMAGGFAQQADENYLNQARKLVDGMKIYIPTKEETERAAQSILLQGEELFPTDEAFFWDEMEKTAENGEVLININKATLEQLCTLPGIGEGKAQNIIEYRTKQGSYGSIEEIMNVEGIKEGLFEKIRDKITVS